MAYTRINFRTKKELKEALASGKIIEVFQPNAALFGRSEEINSGKVYLEGPHYPEAHKWYAQGLVENGRLISVK